MKDFFKNNKKRILKILAVIAIIMIAATVWYEIPVTEHITISGEGKIDYPIRFALVTDLHSCYYGKNQSQLIKMIDKEKPDAILMSGDIFDDRLGQKNARIFTKVWEQMTTAYDFGIRDLWIVNVGDIFSNEYPLGYFLDLAYDFDRYGHDIMSYR